MRTLLGYLSKSLTLLKYHLSPRYVRLKFSGHTLWLNKNWRHERHYFDYLTKGKITGPLAMDLWALSHFVKPGDRVLDAGANIGFTSLLAEKYGASIIHCFEPDPRLLERLEIHCGGKNTMIHDVALGEVEGIRELRLSTSHNQGSTLNDRIIEKFPGVFAKHESAKINVSSVDCIFGTEPFDFFKIDVEGAESALLRGATLTLNKNQPRFIYIEIYDEFFDEVHAFLKKYYEFTYRIICKPNGSGRLFGLQEKVSQTHGLHTMPPSYIYSIRAQDDLTACWSEPKFGCTSASVPQ